MQAARKNWKLIATLERLSASQAVTVLLATSNQPGGVTVERLTFQAPDLVGSSRSAFDDPGLADLVEMLEAWHAIVKAEATRGRNEVAAFDEALQRARAKRARN